MSDMDGIGTRDEWYDERMVDDDMSVAADCRRDGKKERRNAVK